MTFRSSLRDGLWSIAGQSGVASLTGELLHSPRSLRILMYHDVPSQVLSIFESHLKWLAERFEVITPSDFVEARTASNRPKVMLTFDDGCQDNYELVAPLLESHGLRGIFFVCPGFSELSREASFQLLERSSVLLGEKTRDLRWQRISRQQIVDLDRRGHGIGNHTMTHVPLTKLDHQEMVHEISQSAATLKEWLGHPCPFFAWTYSWNEISPTAMKLARALHPYCFSPCSGLNTWPVSERLLWRTGVDIGKPVSNLKSQISGVVDYMYSRQRHMLCSMWEHAQKQTDSNLFQDPKSSSGN